MRIACFPCQQSGNAVRWYRTDLPMSKMKQSDISFDIQFPPRKELIDWADICFFQRYHRKFHDLIQYAKDKEKITVFDTDDLDTCIHPTNNAYWIYVNEKRLPLTKACLREADYVTCTTRQLKYEFSKYNRNVVILRNKIDLLNPIWHNSENKTNFINIGWVGGSSHYYDLTNIMLPWIGQLFRRYKNIKFNLCGYERGATAIDYMKDKNGNIAKVKRWKVDHNPYDTLIKVLKKEIGEENLVVKHSLPLDDYPKLYHDLDIVIAPCEDTRFNQSKSELKAIEAGGCSIPIICSDIKPYREIIKHGENGFLARKKKHWLRFIGKLIEDKALRETMGGNLRKTVQERYDANDQSDRYQFFNEIYEKKLNGAQNQQGG